MCFILIVNVFIRQFQDNFVSCWPYSGFPQNLSGKRKKGAEYSSQRFLTHSTDNQMESAPHLVKSMKLVSIYCCPWPATLYKKNIKIVLLEILTKLTNTTFSREYHVHRLTGAAFLSPLLSSAGSPRNVCPICNLYGPNLPHGYILVGDKSQMKMEVKMFSAL